MVVTFSVRITGERELFSYMRRVSQKEGPEANRMTRELANKHAWHAKRLAAPGRTGTGDLKRSIHVIPVHGKNKGYIVRAGEGLTRPEAWFQEYGFAPHTISLMQLDPRVRKRWSIFGYKFDVFRHTPYMKPALDKVLTTFDIDAIKYADRILGG